MTAEAAAAPFGPAELPPPHLAHDRVCVGTIGPWEVRVFAVNDTRHRYLADRGMLHLQLWHPQARISILSRSGLTRGQWEVCGPDGRHRCACYPCLRRFIAQRADVVAPCARLVSQHEQWFVFSVWPLCVPTPLSNPTSRS